MKQYIMDEDNNIVEEPDLIKWGRWFSKNTKRIIGKETIGDILVSTVFLGLDHGPDPQGRPLLFETMVFGGEHDQECIRTATLCEAEACHKSMVDWIKGNTKMVDKMNIYKQNLEEQ